MFRFLVLCLVFISSNARYYRRTRNYCYFRNAGRITRFSKSSTQFFVRNTFLQVETTLTARSIGWWRRGSSTGFFRYWLPNKAVVSSLRLQLKNRYTGAVTWYDGYVTTNQQATQDFYRTFGTNKAQLIYRWTNEQFAMVALRTRFRKRNLVSIVIGWEYAIELQYDRFQFDFPIPLPGAYSYSRLSVYGSIVEDGRPINSITVQSPGPMDLGNGNVIEPICQRVVNSSLSIDCGQRTDVNQVDISFDVTYGQYRYWLSKRKAYRYPWWYYWQQWKQCSPHKVSHGGSDSDSSEYRRGRNNLRKAIYGSSIAHDLVFSVTYNHTLLPLTELGSLPPFYGAFLDDLYVNWVWGSDNDSCWMIGISAEEAFFQQEDPIGAPVQLFPVLRRATFFIDDNTGVTAAYYSKVKAAVSRILVEAGTPRPIQQQANSILLDRRNFDFFRIVVLSGNGMVYKFPNVPASQKDKFANATAFLQDGLNFINSLPDPPLCQVRPGFTFTETKTEFLNVMQEYTDLVTTMGLAGKNEISDVFYFANSKPEGTNGNFASNTRRQFLLAIRDKQSVLRAFTTRAYGQAIFTFGFGPNSDFNLLDAISANNWGATTMAFADDNGETLEAQALQFYRGIGRVLMSRVNVTRFRAVYGSEGDLFSPGTATVLELNSSIEDAGYLIPLVRDSQYINVVVEAPPFFNGLPIVGFLWRMDFIPGGSLQLSNIEEFNMNASRAIIRRPGDPDFGRVNDKLNFTANFDDGLSLCKYGNVVRVHSLEAALRTKQMFPDDVSLSVAEINARIEKAGLQGGLQTSQTSMVVAQTGALLSTEAPDGQAYTVSNTNGAFAVVDVRFGLFVTAIVFSIVFY